VLVRVVVADEVVPHVDGRHLGLHLVLRLHDLVRLELTGSTLGVRLAVGRGPVGQHRRLVRGHRRQRGPDRDVLLVDPLLRRVVGALLEGHAGPEEAGGRHRVAVAHVEQVVDGVVEVRDALPVELVLHRRAVQVVDPADRLVGDLVVDRVRVRREEVRLRAHLAEIDAAFPPPRRKASLEML
jgi:hypothetical protein